MKNFFRARVIKYEWNWAYRPIFCRQQNPFYFEIRQQKKWGPFTWWSHYDTVFGSDTAYELTKELNRKLNGF